MATRLQKKDIQLCASCSKPVGSEHLKVHNKLRTKEKWVYHLTPRECAYAPELEKDWRRRGGTERDNGTRDGLPGVDGHTRYTDYNMSVWFEGMESKDNI